LCVGHAYSCPVQWDCEVKVFGRRVRPGQLIHADKHGFLVVPREDENRLLEAARFMDTNECRTMIQAARSCDGAPLEEVVATIDPASQEFRRAAKQKFSRKA